MLRTMRRGPVLDCASSGSTATPGATAIGLVSLMCLNPRPRNRVILAQRMAFPFVGQHDAAQVGMFQEAYAEQVEHLALIPVRGAPHGGHGIDNRVNSPQPAFQAHALLAVERM